MARNFYLVWIGAMALMATGCAVYRPVTAGPVNLAKYGISSELAADDWMRRPVKNGEVLTRDGLELGYIRVTRQAVNERLEHTGLPLRTDMRPVELMEIELDDLRSQRKTGYLRIESVEPVTLDGRDGFRMAYSLRRHNGLRVRGIRYGMLADRYYYRLQLEAARGHYFEKYRKDFENFAKYLKVL